MYRLSQNTSGMETAIHATVRLEAVCDQPDGGGGTTAMELDTARLARDSDGDESPPGAGDEVELRELLRGEPLVGDMSGGGKSLG